MAQVVKNPPANAGDSRDVGSSWVGKIPWSRKWQPLPVFLPSKFHGWEAWRTTVHGVTQSRTWLSTSPPHTHTCTYSSLWGVNLPLRIHRDSCLQGSSVRAIFQTRILEGVSPFLLQGIFLTQGLNPHLLSFMQWQEIMLPLSHLGSP